MKIHHNHRLFILPFPHIYFCHLITKKSKKKTGNSLIVNIGLSDLAVSIVVIPISIVSLLAMNKDEDLPPLSVCKFQWFLAACTFLISVLTLAVSSFFIQFFFIIIEIEIQEGFKLLTVNCFSLNLNLDDTILLKLTFMAILPPLQVTSIENYMRLCTSQQDGTQWFGRSNITAIILLIWFIGCVASGLQYVYDVSFDYCNRKNNKNLLPIETGKLMFAIINSSLCLIFGYAL